jgi:hypothetical protein
MDPRPVPRAVSLKSEAERGTGGLAVTGPEAADSEPRGRVLACAACQRPITSDAGRITVAGRHEHTFANPFGYAYHIGCFSTAGGLTRVGPASAEFAWFVGHTWQIEQCTGCGEHLGWLFRGSASAFHGLILDRLVEVEGPPP